MQQVIYNTECFNLLRVARGKVRDVYDVGNGHLLFVATDRISAFDVVSSQPIPEKGRVLTAMTVFWFDWLATNFPWIKTHFITADWDEMTTLHPDLVQYEDQLRFRSMLVHKMDRILPLEVIIRLYLYGSGYEDYKNTGEVCGIALPPGLKKADLLPFPMFSPSTKAPAGRHDQNISIAEAIRSGLITQTYIMATGGVGISVLTEANKEARKRGLVLCDTKFEFGMLDGDLALADEVLTPDSSRFWPIDEYEPGKDQPSFDKQFVRDHLQGLVKQGKWDKLSPMPELPDEIIQGTTQRYLEVLSLFTGS